MTAITHAKPRTLGNSKLSVFPIGLGCMSFSGAYGKSDDAEAIRVIHHALDRGCGRRRSRGTEQERDRERRQCGEPHRSAGQDLHERLSSRFAASLTR